MPAERVSCINAWGFPSLSPNLALMLKPGYSGMLGRTEPSAAVCCGRQLHSKQGTGFVPLQAVNNTNHTQEMQEGSLKPCVPGSGAGLSSSSGRQVLSAAAQEAQAGLQPRCEWPCLHGSTATALQGSCSSALHRAPESKTRDEGIRRMGLFLGSSSTFKTPLTCWKK